MSSSRRAASSRHSVPARDALRANSSSSPRPNRGERSSAARLRSSSGSSTKRPSAIKSITAICSVQPDAVGARHRHAAQLELADHFAGERLAPRHQDHDVAGTDRLLVARQSRSAVGPGLDAIREPFGKPYHRARSRIRHPPACQGSGSGVLIGLSAGQNSTQASCVLAMGVMGDLDAVRCDAVARRLVGEYSRPRIREFPAPSGATW